MSKMPSKVNKIVHSKGGTIRMLESGTKYISTLFEVSKSVQSEISLLNYKAKCKMIP
jgi:hypothetical protein